MIDIQENFLAFPFPCAGCQITGALFEEIRHPILLLGVLWSCVAKLTAWWDFWFWGCLFWLFCFCFLSKKTKTNENKKRASTMKKILKCSQHLTMCCYLPANRSGGGRSCMLDLVVINSFTRVFTHSHMPSNSSGLWFCLLLQICV